MDWFLHARGEIMDGVQILNIIQRADMTPFGIFCGVVMLVSGMFAIVAVGCESKKWVAIFIIFFIIGCVMMCSSKSETKIMRYEAIIDDSVSYIELTEKYNVIEQRGEIFVLEEKVD